MVCPLISLFLHGGKAAGQIRIQGDSRLYLLLDSAARVSGYGVTAVVDIGLIDGVLVVVALALPFGVLSGFGVDWRRDRGEH